MTTIAKTMTILCPDWCTTGGPGVTTRGSGRAVQLHVDHQGPHFGDHMYGNGAQVEADVQGEVMVTDLESTNMTRLSYASSPLTPWPRPNGWRFRQIRR